MKIFEALFGLTDIYHKAQEKRKTRIERKHVLETPVYGRMPQECETREKMVNCEPGYSEAGIAEEKKVCRAAEFVTGKKPASKEDVESLDHTSRELLLEIKVLLEKADEILEEYEVVQKKLEEQSSFVQVVQESLEDQHSAVQTVQKSLEEHCNTLEEKIHTENVKSYRNVQAALDDMNKEVAKEESLVLLVSSLRNQIKCSTWFSVITLLVLIAYILFSLGVF